MKKQGGGKKVMFLVLGNIWSSGKNTSLMGGHLVVPTQLVFALGLG